VTALAGLISYSLLCMEQIRDAFSKTLIPRWLCHTGDRTVKLDCVKNIVDASEMM